MKTNKLRQAGFTIIELLVVMAIITILASMLLPSLTRAKEQAQMIQCLNNLRQIGMGIKLYVDDHHGQFPLPYAIEPDTKQRKGTRFTLGGFDPDPERLDWFPTAVSRPLYRYLKPSEVYRCPVDKGQVVHYIPNQCAPPPLQPSNWKTVGCSYHYNAGGLTYLRGGGFKEPPEDSGFGLADKVEGWVPSPDRYILLHEPSARLYGYKCVQVFWFQWHFRRGP